MVMRDPTYVGREPQHPEGILEKFNAGGLAGVTNFVVSDVREVIGETITHPVQIDLDSIAGVPSVTFTLCFTHEDFARLMKDCIDLFVQKER